MKYRKLRIGWSVAWGLAAVLLIALWVRSYWHVINPQITTLRGDAVTYLDSQKRLWQLFSSSGAIFLSVTKQEPSWPFGPTIRPGGWKINCAQPQLLGFGFLQEGRSTSAILPNWFPLLACITLAAVAWIHQLRWQFSLRTLLVATTLIAVGLGLVVWAMR